MTATPLADPLAAVRLLTCVQAQDAPLARYSIGMRSGADDAAVRAAIDEGVVVRTHILRPTWHVVAAEDLRWILELTSSKVVSGMAARHRRLGLTSPVVGRAERALADVLAGRRFLTRADLRRVLGDAGVADRGDQLAHLVMLAELRGLDLLGTVARRRAHVRPRRRGRPGDADRRRSGRRRPPARPPLLPRSRSGRRSPTSSGGRR